MKFVASRLSRGNKIFPEEIYIEETGIKLKQPGIFSGKTQFISYEHISSVEIDSPLVGFSTLRFFHAGKEVVAHGFIKDDAAQIEIAIADGRKKASNK